MSSVIVVRILDEYTGHVDQGGAAARRVLPAMTISKMSVGGDWDNSVYLLACRTTNEALLIDAAAEPERIMDMLGHDSSRPTLRKIITTHGHPDHWQALGAVAGATGAATIAHPDDAGDLPIPLDQSVVNGDTVTIGEITLSIIHLRGHTPGSIAVLYEDPTGHPHLFTGDSLFPGGVGKTNSPEDFESLITDVTERIFDRLPDDTWFYPGHGDDSTLGAQRPHLAEWRARGW